MEWAAALSTKRAVEKVVADLVQQLQARLGAGATDVGFLFVHPSYFAAMEDIVEALRAALGVRQLVGCSGAGIIGLDQEIEEEPAISMLVGRLPNVTVTGFALQQDQLEEGPTDAAYWHYQLDVLPEPTPMMVLFSDPFTVHPIELVNALAAAYPGAPLVGGLVSGGRQPGQVRLILNGEISDSGAVGVALQGPVGMRTIVSQGCRPIGEPLIITRAEKNVIHELAGRPPIEVLQELLPRLPPADQQLARKALFLGRVINEYKEEYKRGDFLIRNLIGRDPSSGALAVGDVVRAGQTVQFHVRDGRSA
ncbi:MAG: FIST C-terminal domain-containing protein, partial [Verrucomicrobiae bacterium]|nr:FIST C-terminal domain-containing protein [Verrucomicrobiae bacterium]